MLIPVPRERQLALTALTHHWPGYVRLCWHCQDPLCHLNRGSSHLPNPRRVQVNCCGTDNDYGHELMLSELQNFLLLDTAYIRVGVRLYLSVQEPGVCCHASCTDDEFSGLQVNRSAACNCMQSPPSLRMIASSVFETPGCFKHALSCSCHNVAEQTSVSALSDMDHVARVCPRLDPIYLSLQLSAQLASLHSCTARGYTSLAPHPSVRRDICLCIHGLQLLLGIVIRLPLILQVAQSPSVPWPKLQKQLSASVASLRSWVPEQVVIVSVRAEDCLIGWWRLLVEGRSDYNPLPSPAEVYLLSAFVANLVDFGGCCRTYSSGFRQTPQFRSQAQRRICLNMIPDVVHFGRLCQVTPAMHASALCPTCVLRTHTTTLQNVHLPCGELWFRSAFMCQCQALKATRVGEAANPGPQADIRTFFPRGEQQVPVTTHASDSRPAAPALDTADTLQTNPTATPPGISQPVASSSQQEDSRFSVAVVNPTAVQGKVPLMLELRADVLLMSETSAVETVQQRAQREFKSSGYACVWGNPVQAHVSPKTGQATLRGHAVGVGIAARLPLSCPPVPLPAAHLATQRLSEAMLRVGPMQVRLICVYGFPSAYTDAKQRNDDLLQMALQRVAQSRVPTLVGGDMNMDVTQLPGWEHFAHLGYQEFFQFHQRRFGQQLPPTCRGATRHDTLLLPPVLQAMVLGARVDSCSGRFDAHDALLVTFRSEPPECPKSWRMPRSWCDFHPDMNRACKLYATSQAHVREVIADCSSPEDVSKAFETWASALESAVDASLHQSHVEDPLLHPCSGLPRAARGRCVYRSRVARPAPEVAPAARNGDYAPQFEAVSMTARRQVKQVRRIQTLLRGLSNWDPGAAQSASAKTSPRQQFLQEWKAVRVNKAFGPRFEVWLLGFQPFSHVWQHLPPVDWLRDVYHFAKHMCDTRVCQEARVRQRRFAYLVQLDTVRNGQKMGFAQLRPRPRPPVTSLPVNETRFARRAHSCGTHSALYEIANPQFLRLHGPLQTTVGPAVVDALLVETDGERADMAELRFLEQCAPEQCTITQGTQAVTCTELHREFVEFWTKIWWRDTKRQATDLAQWPEFLAQLPPCPADAAPVDVDMLDVKLWEQALKRLKPHRATGYDGFSPDELKELHGRPLEDLIALFAVAVDKGFPSHMARARVHTLAKCDSPQSFADGRPITIFATIYRLWSGIVARELLRAWATWLPASVAGSMPHRSAHDVAYRLQSAIEEALQGRQPLGGFSIDITKCFNQLPRQPIGCLMQHLGAPGSLIRAWLQFLEVSERCPVLAGGVGTPVGATTGTPEGDALSVAAMASVCWLFAEHNKRTQSVLLSFVDNFSWMSPHKDSLRDSLVQAQSLCSVLQLPIDWFKSFSWATTPALKRFWDRDAPTFLPPGTQLRRVQDAKDLGVWFQFQSRRKNQTSDKRLHEGKARLDRLRKQPRPLFSKLRLLLGGIWPQIFYGMEGRVLPKQEIDRVRSKAARALCNTGPSQSPYLLLAAAVPPMADPEVYLLVQAVTALRRAFQVQPQTASLVLKRACLSADAVTPCGPATALALMLSRNGWRLNEQGWCTGPGMQCFSVRHSSRRQICKAVQRAWTDILHTKIEHRTGLHALGALASCDTVAVLRSLPHDQQRVAVNAVTGGHMSAAAKCQWDPTLDDKCEFCGQRDTKYHRVFECPLFSEIRKAFSGLLSWMQLHAMHWIHAACIEEHPDLPVVRAIFRCRPCVAPPALRCPPVQGRRILYTDGSCTVTEIAEARHAAWAVVEDAAQHIPTCALIQHFQQSQRVIQGFHVVAQGLVPREQSIGRAEVIAVLQACLLAHREPEVRFLVYVDSTYALGFFHKLPLGPGPHKGPATDVDLCHWTQVWYRPPNMECFKVKSHTNLNAVPLPEARHALGNAVADIAAKAARQADASSIYDLLEEVNARQSTHRTMLRSYFLYQHYCCRQVSLARQHSSKQNEDGVVDTPGLHRAENAWQALSPVHTCVVVWPQLSRAWLVCAPWPPWYVSAVWQWATALQWPPMQGPLGAPTNSVTFLELLCDFVVTQRVAPPVVAQGDGGTCLALDSNEAKLLPTSTKDLIVTFAATIRYLEKASKTTLMLGLLCNKVKSLHVVGCQAARRGYVPRPLLASQRLTGALVLELLAADHPVEVLRLQCSCTGRDRHDIGSPEHAEWLSLTCHQKELMRKKLFR